MIKEENYEYPIDPDWNQTTLLATIDLYNAVEAAYESSIERDVFLKKYRDWQNAIPMKMERRNLSKEFEEQSSYSIYQVWKLANADKNKKTLRIRN